MEQGSLTAGSPGLETALLQHTHTQPCLYIIVRTPDWTVRLWSPQWGKNTHTHTHPHTQKMDEQAFLLLHPPTRL